MMTIQQIIDGSIEFNFGNVQQALMERDAEPLTIAESSELLKVAEKYYRKSLASIIDPNQKAIRIKQIEQTIENILHPYYWNFNTIVKTRATDSLRHFCQVAAEKLQVLIDEPNYTKKQKEFSIPETRSTGLKQLELALLFNLLQEKDIIHSSVSKTDLSKLISYLTGFGAGDMRNSLSEDRKIVSVDFPEVISRLKRKLTELDSVL